MKTKMMKKLISVVCAAALTTSCSAMSVGAVPIQISQADWEQGYAISNALLKCAEEVAVWGCVFDQCTDLADEIEEFLNGTAYTALLSEISENTKADFLREFYDILDDLRSEELERRERGTTEAFDNLHAVSDLIEEHIDEENTSEEHIN